MISRDDVIASVREVPSLPSVVIKLRQYLNDPEVDFGALARVIEFDPGLTANVLQLANSAYFGWTRSISSIQDAIVRLGTARIFQMVLCMSVAPMVRKPIKGYGLDSDQLWQHSISVAIGAEQLAAILNKRNAGDAFTSGLLHDIGKVVLGTYLEVDDKEILALVEDGISFDEAETHVLGINHAETASLLLEQWNLPETVVDAVRYHHEPEAAEESSLVTDLVHVADSLCMRAGFGLGIDGLTYSLSMQATERLGLTMDVAEKIIVTVMDSLDELQSLYSPSAEGSRDNAERTPVR